MYKMIVIDDEYLVRLGIKETIEWSKYDIEIVASAKNGKEGLELIRTLKPDLIISDVKMPIMDGVELLHELSKQPIDAKIIMLSGYKDFEYAKNSLETGAYSYLLKPINNDDLIKCVCDALEELKKIRIKETKLARFDKELPLIKTSIIQKLLTGEYSLSEIEKNNKELGYNIPEKGFVCISKIDKSTNIEDKSIIKDSLNDLYKISSEALEKINHADILFFSHFVMLIEKNEIVNDDYLYNLFKKVIDKYSDSNAVVSIAISEEYQSLDDVFDKYVCCKKIFKNKMIPNLNSVTNYKDSYVNFREEVTKTMNFIAQNYASNISAKIVANKLGISESYLMHILKDELGKTFNEVLTEYRIDKAKTLLQVPDCHVYDVGMKVGYNDTKYFRRIFMRIVGCTPNEYRKRI